MPLGPPAIQNTQTGNSVERRFHAARSGGFERKLRRVEPKVHARSHLATELEVVLVQENDGNSFPKRLLRLENVSDDVLAARVVRMSFAGVDNLELTRVFGDQPQTVEIGQEQVRAFVTGGPA